MAHFCRAQCPPPAVEGPDRRETMRALEHQECLKLVDQMVTQTMQKQHRSSIFIPPVDPKAMNAPDYFNVVEKPMCIDQIRVRPPRAGAGLRRWPALTAPRRGLPPLPRRPRRAEKHHGRQVQLV